MLSRVAESLFWIARNIERAETLARLLDFTAAGSVDRGSHHRDAVARQWDAVYTVAGIERPEPAQRTHAAEAAEAVERIAFGEDRHSIGACVRIARRNAVGVRAELTTEVWECLNGLYLFVEAQSPRALGPDGASSFLRSVRDTAQAFAGICDATLSHDDAWDFLVVGRYLERASVTARILGAHDGDDGTHAWQRILEACCASEPFARARRQSSDPADALAFLALGDVFPRSIRFCVREVDRALHRVSGTSTGTFANEAERASGRIAAALDYLSPAEVHDEGAPAFAARAQRWVTEIGEAITAAYFPRVPVA